MAELTLNGARHAKFSNHWHLRGGFGTNPGNGNLPPRQMWSLPIARGPSPGTLAVIDTSSGVINTIQVGPRPEPPVSSLPPGGMPGLMSPDLGEKQSGGAKTPAGETPKKLPKATN